MNRMFLILGVVAATGFAQDVVQVAPDQVKVIFENDQVRVLRFTEPGHSKLPMHSHSVSYVAVGFNADDSKYTFPDGKTSEERTKAGEVTYSKSVTHASENLTDKASEAVMVELKDHAGASPSAKTELDPVKVDPKHYKVLIDNDQVRVLRATYGPHEKSVMHEHPNSVAVFMTGGHVKFNLADGTSQDSDAKAHDAIWTPAGKHLPVNLTDKRMEVVVVELK